MNEEEIKVKYVLPWLKEAGVDLHELQLERTFSIRIGRQTIPIGGCPGGHRAAGRLDILVRRNDRNLFVVETKAADESLTDDDRDQAISYARLVHPVAPYAIVTNGSDYRIYHTLTKEHVPPTEIRIRGFEAVLPDADIAEAQSAFLGLNRSNLVRFCQQQVASELSLVKGTLDEGRKYVPELHVPRDSIQKEVAGLYRSSLPGLLITGQSGFGKTCELCFIAESLAAREQPVLFFNGISLTSDIPNAIAAEFSWAFNGSDTSIQTLKRLESILRNDFLTIIVDAIDEWTSPNRTAFLGALLRAAEHRRIRLIFSCKTSAVDPFLFQRLSPTHVTLLAQRVEMDALSPKEFFNAVQKYRHVYGFFGRFEDVVLKEAQENPFLLRVLFDVARDSRIRHLTFSSSQFFDEYYTRSLSKTHDSKQANETLKAIARLHYERNADWISESDVRSALGLRVNESLMPELFEYGLLHRSAEESGDRSIGFYFQQLRDYIIAFRALRFDEMAPAQLRKDFDSVAFPSTRGDVFVLYYRLARLEHQLVFDGEVRNNAAEYLGYYKSLVEQHFTAIRDAMSPGGDLPAGLVGEFVLPRLSIGLYGFRPLESGDDEVHLMPTQQAASDSNLAGIAGARTMHLRSTAKGFRNGIDIRKEVVEYEILPQIRELVQLGRLNESSTPDLSAELIVELVSANPGIFRPLLEPNQRSIRYPLKLNAVLDCVLREKLLRHFRDEIVAQKRARGEIREHWTGSTVTYSSSLSAYEEAEAATAADDALANHQIPDFRAVYVELDELERRLRPAVNSVCASRSEISVPPFGGSTQRDLLPIFDGSAPSSDYHLSDYIRSLYLAFLANYRTLIDTNFPTLRMHFKTYASTAQSHYFILGPPARFDLDRQLTIYSVKSGTAMNTVEFIEKSRVESDNGRNLKIDDTTYDAYTWTSTTVGSFLERNNSFGRMHLRHLVYSTISKELPAVESALRSQVGL